MKKSIKYSREQILCHDEETEYMIIMACDATAEDAKEPKYVPSVPVDEGASPLKRRRNEK